MDNRMRFSKINVEKSLDHFFAPQSSRMARVNNDEGFHTHYNKRVAPGPDMQQCMPNNTSDYVNNFEKPKEYTSHYYHANNRQLETNLSNEQEAREYCKNMRISTNYDKTDSSYFPKKYKSDDQLKKNIMYYQEGKPEHTRVYRDITAPKNGPRFDVNLNARRSISEELFSQRQRIDEITRKNSFPTKMNDFDRNFEHVKRNRTEVDDEHHFRTNTMSMQPNPVPRFDSSINYNRHSRANENVSRLRSVSGESKPIKKLDDGFVCVRNPDFFPDYHGDNEHVSRDTRGPKQRRHYAEFQTGRKLSPYRSFLADINPETRKGKHSERVRKFQEMIKQKREIFKRNKGVGEAHTKINKINAHQAQDLSKSKYHWKKGDTTLSPKNLHKTSDKSKYTYINKQTPYVKTSSGISKLKDVEKIPKEKPVIPRIERKKIYAKMKIQKKIAIAASYAKQKNNRREKQKELMADGVFGEPSDGQIKYEPEKYWKIWWTKYAYVENTIDKVDAESLADNLKFRCDLNDPTLDSQINDIYIRALTQIKLTSTITEVNYERRRDGFATLKYLKILEDKEFQSFLVPRESKHIAQVLMEEKQNKRRLALLHQSVICSWHCGNLSDTGDDTFPVQIVKHAKSLRKDELFRYIVLDSISELKKLTADDWPGFEDFYKTLK